MEGLRVRDVMTPDVTTLKQNDKLTLADDIMHLGRIRHLPVLDDDGQQVVGLVSQRDLFRGALARALGLRAARAAKSPGHALSQRSNDQRRDHDQSRHALGGRPSFGGAEVGLPAGGRGRTPRRHPNGGRLRGHGRAQALQLGAHRLFHG